MSRWTVHDRFGNEIYMTEERWNYILRYHDELDGLLSEVLETLKIGKRRQEPTHPNKYKYYKHCDDLPTGFNTIVIVVKFSTRLQPDGTFISNNFVITAWGVDIYRQK